MEGRRVVLLVAVCVVAVSAAVAATVPLLLPELGSPPLLPLPPTPAGYAVYGATVTALLLGVGLLAVEAASRAEGA